MSSLLRALALGLPLLGCVDAPIAPRAPAPLARFVIREPLEHDFRDEIIELDLDRDPGPVHLLGSDGRALPLEIDARGERVKARTVVTLPRGAEIVLTLHEGAAPPPFGVVTVRREPAAIVLANDRFEISIPRWIAPRSPADIRAMPAPFGAVRRAGGAWIGEGAWSSAAPILVRDADTAIVAEGPVLASVRRRLVFADGHTYQATISLGAQQDTATIVEDADVDAPPLRHHISLPGDVVWQNQWKATEGAGIWGYVESSTAKEGPLFAIRPWSFWWLPRISAWAGFGPKGGDTMVGVLAIKPSRWTPTEWAGFDKTEIPVAAKAGRAELTFSIASSKGAPLHREWAVSAAPPPEGDSMSARVSALRRQLVKRSEWPLADILRMRLDAPIAPRAHPSLLFDAADLARARRQAKTSPASKARLRAAEAYIAKYSDMDAALAKGPEAFYDVYAHHAFHEPLPEAYLASDDPRYARWLTASVEGLARRVVQFFLEAPERPSLGANGPWFSEEVTRLALTWDLVGDKVPPDRAAFIQRALIFGAHILDHPDYWNPQRGLASANPNMTSAIALPRGLLGALLRGHPDAERWLRGAEGELAHEIANWIAPGGAWIESPGYQAASLDAMLLLASALRRTTGRDVFSDAKLKDTLDYSGFLLTAPDPRFARAPIVDQGSPAPMVQPSIGHTHAGWITPFNGWMAKETAATDPAFSARQQFYWKRQASTFGNAGRAKGLVAALVDPDLPDRPPEETSRAFPGFGAVLRSSWTDPRQSYLALTTGPHVHHYNHGEHGSIVYYAKGAPLCLDWGNVYAPVTRWEAWYHNTVSFEVGGDNVGMTGAIGGVRSLPGFAESAHGKSKGAHNQESHREILMVESKDPMGANYLVMRDRTVDGRRGQRFWYNLFCLSKPPEVRPGFAHFPGQMGVDLDVFFLSPDKVPITTDHWKWKEHIYTWGVFEEEQHGIRALKEGSKEDFFTVLYPRAPGERAPLAKAVAGGAAAWITHAEGADLVLLSPGKPTSAREGGAVLSGEIAWARRASNGTLRLAVVAGDASAEIGGWGIASRGPLAIEVSGATAKGVTSGEAREARLTLPARLGRAIVRLDGREIAAARAGAAITVALPAGLHHLAIEGIR